MSGKGENELGKQSQSLDSESDNPITTPSPTPRVSLPLRFSNPDNPIFERPIGDISPNTIFVRTGVLIEHNTELIQNVSVTLGEVDNVLGVAENQLNQNLLDQTNIQENVIMSEVSQIGNMVHSALLNAEEGQVGPGQNQGNTNEISTIFTKINSNRPSEKSNEDSISQSVRNFLESRYPSVNLNQELEGQYIGLEAALK